jgi:hypothetical protein
MAQKTTTGLAELIGRALTDKEFRQRLFDDRKAALRGVSLSAADQEALDSLTREDLDRHAALMGDKTALTIKVVIKKKF